MKRFSDWEARLSVFLEKQQSVVFAWGTSDCALFACDAVLAITGVDLAADFRGKYSTELGAARAIKKFCGGGLEQLAEKVAQQNDIKEVPVFMAQRGDVVLVDIENPQLGIVSMNGWNVATFYVDGQQGYTLDGCRRAWRIS